MSGTLAETLSSKKRVCIDSMTMIYFIERHSTYLEVVKPLFELVDAHRLHGFSSYLMLLEVLVQPLKRGRHDLVEQYRDILVHSGSFVLIPIDRDVAEKSAGIRARYGVKTPDAIQLATAMLQGADAFVTNDGELRRFAELEILVLADYLRPR